MVFQLGNLSIDGSKIRANASKHQAVSYKQLLELENELLQQGSELFALGEQADQGDLLLPPVSGWRQKLPFSKNASHTSPTPNLL